ncbi:MAG: polysaccharide biosynthesis protein [Oscillospiraceae bacterium]|nr:polysaccharide biosynthesis protein [Oscillospiraceae bacterium]
MTDSSKKQTFLHGAALLAIATAVVKVIGAFYKIPLKAIIGDEGYGYFSTAYDIYSVLLLISTAGLPVAMSRMISSASTLGQYNQVRRTYKTAKMIFIGLGLASTLFMVLGSKWLANLLEQPAAWTAILCLGPCAIFMGLISTYRGFFQGQENMRPTSVSQVLEAVAKLVVGLGAAYLIIRTTNSLALASAGSILGVTVSCLISAMYLFGKVRKDYHQMPQTEETPFGYKATAKQLLAIAVPITIGAAGLQLLTVAESGLYMNRLVHLVETNQYAKPLVEAMKAEILSLDPSVTAGEMPQRVAAGFKGIYNFAQTIFNMPCSFIVPISISVIPAITSHLTLQNNRGVRETEESAARITGLISLPCSVGLCVLAKPVMALLGGYTGLKLELAASLMMALGACVFLYSIIQYTNSLMQAHGYAFVPVVNMLLVGVVKLAVVYILTGNPNLGILGAPIGAVLSYGAIAVLNLIAIHKMVPQKPALTKNLLRSVLPAAIMGVAVFGVYQLMLQLLGQEGSRVLLCGAPIAVGVVVYAISAVLCKSFTAADCQLLPKGDKVAKLLKL